MTETYDYVIVGAGSAGCAMAYRLAENGKNTVCVMEFGGSDRGPFIQMPSALSYPMNMNLYNWGFETEPEPQLGGRRLVTPRIAAQAAASKVARCSKAKRRARPGLSRAAISAASITKVPDPHIGSSSGSAPS